MSLPYLTHFKTTEAVETWDQWFRLRVDGRLRDVTIDDTWQRAAQALAVASPLNGDYWANRYVAAFSAWKIMPGTQWLRNAGTPLQAASSHAGCVVNLAAHVVRKPSGWLVDDEALRDSAALAVRLADDILSATGRGISPCAEVGVVGVGTAVVLLGLEYDEPRARSCMQRCFRSMSEAAWFTSAQLAGERGPHFAADHALRAMWHQRDVAPGTLEFIERTGLRFRRALRVTMQPLLAQLAGVTDALEPASDTQTAPRRRICAELKLRASLRPWVDEPLDLPLVATPSPVDDHDHYVRLTRRLHIPMPFLVNGSDLGQYPLGATT